MAETIYCPDSKDGVRAVQLSKFFTKVDPLRFIALSLLLLIVPGCGGQDRPKTVSVKGTVLYKGVALTDANVEFVPESGRPASGTTDANGEFTLTTFENNDGVIPGQHMITVQKLQKNESTDPYAEQKSLIPTKYSQLRTTPLTQTVTDGENAPLKIELED